MFRSQLITLDRVARTTDCYNIRCEQVFWRTVVVKDEQNHIQQNLCVLGPDMLWKCAREVPQRFREGSLRRSILAKIPHSQTSLIGYARGQRRVSGNEKQRVTGERKVKRTQWGGVE